ncbi:condensation domain-containing protein, partial [Streptacidiphilus sp. EB129]|uniref:condensation domain-containing protein n=1 Tax=Streptacidiphilus sp. EB129 TaxID=3156262 RepID=UPI00351117FC
MTTTTGTPLSFGQEQLWFLDQLAPGETTYNILLAWRLHGRLDVDVLRRCLTLVVSRHEALRATLHTTDGTPFQVIAEPPAEVGLTVVDLTALDPSGWQQAIDADISAQTNLPFDLETGPLYRFRLLTLADDEYVLVQGFHHLVTDGWSSAVMNAEITTAYQALLNGDEPVFEQDDPGYTSFAGSQRERLDGAELEEELTFWQEKLAHLSVLELPTDRPRPQTSNHRGGSVIKTLPDGLLDRARATAQEHGVSLFMVLSAAFNTVLARYSGQDDIAVGVPMLGRVDPELENVVGLFINMAVLRSDLSGDPTFTELLERTADANLELYEHQEVPFHQVVDRVQPVREPGRNPLFQVAVQLLGGATSGDNLFFPGVTSEYMLLPSAGARFDISLNFIESDDTLKASVEYSSELFDQWRIEAMLGHIETVLTAAA